MARVVQRRSGPPYLLIIFVFLFLVAATLAVLLFMQRDKVMKAGAQKAQLLDKVLSATEQQRSQIVEMLDKAPREGTVVAQLDGQVGRLVHLITGRPTATVAAAEEEADKAYELVGTRAGLAGTVIEAYKLIDSARQDSKAWQTKYDEAGKQLEVMRKSLLDQKGQFDQASQGMDAKIAELTKKFDEFQKAHEGRLEQAKSEWAQQQAEYERQIAGKVQESQEQQVKEQRLLAEIEKLRRRLEEKLGQGGDPNAMLTRIDGKILRTLDQEATCYVDLGAKEGVTVGLTFSVYASSNIPDSGQGKGTIRVNKVSDNVSECTVTRQDPKDPIMPGDLVANVAYDALRSYTFVVEGVFDLHGTGRATPEGAEEIRTLIQRFGAAVAKDLDFNTDFVVIWEEPTPPPRPIENAPRQVWEVYNEQMKGFKHYQDVKAMAQQMRVPVLNTNRFLAYVGYVPGEAISGR